MKFKVFMMLEDDQGGLCDLSVFSPGNNFLLKRVQFLVICIRLLKSNLIVMCNWIKVCVLEKGNYPTTIFLPFIFM